MAHRLNFYSQRTNKFNAKSQNYNGKWYHSKKEASYAETLDWRQKAGEIKEIIPQYKISLDVNGKHITNYYCDFKIILPNGSIEFHEVKGFLTDVSRLKLLLFEALINEIEPGAELIVIK